MSRPFRLATVLRLRETAEEVARGGLARSIEADRAALADLQIRRAAAHAERDHATSLARARITAGRLTDAATDVARADREVATHSERSSAAARSLVESRDRLAEATRKREVVERLRDRVERIRRLEDQRREQAHLDEIGTLGYVARSARRDRR